MIDMIAKLIETGHAYAAASGSVYFDARSVPDYGALSGNRLDELQAWPPVRGRRRRGEAVPRRLGAVEERRRPGAS